MQLIAIGGIIGSGYFIGSGVTISEAGPSAIISYLLGGFIVFAVMQSFAELLVNFPREGHFVALSAEFLGPVVATGVGWAYWANWVAYIPAEGVALGLTLRHFIGGPVLVYAAGGLVLIVTINLLQVSWFGHVESIFAVLKILAILVFAICAVLFISGAVGPAIGVSIIYDPSIGVGKSLFPGGVLGTLPTMVITLVNYQGSEIVGITSAEAVDGAASILRACRGVALRIVLIYVVPISLLMFILPYKDAALDESVFAAALERHGLHWAGEFFNAVVLVSALSCGNSGFYAAARSLYGLARDGLAPRIFLRTNRWETPWVATVATGVAMSPFVVIAVFAGASRFYTMCLGLAGFTGSICWGAIITAQLLVRWRLWRRGFPSSVLQGRAFLSPVLPLLGLVALVGSLVFMAFSSDMFHSFLFSLGITVLPMILYFILNKCGCVSPPRALADNEIPFDTKFPPMGISQGASLLASNGRAFLPRETPLLEEV